MWQQQPCVWQQKSSADGSRSKGTCRWVSHSQVTWAFWEGKQCLEMEFSSGYVCSRAFKTYWKYQFFIIRARTAPQSSRKPVSCANRESRNEWGRKEGREWSGRRRKMDVLMSVTQREGRFWGQHSSCWAGNYNLLVLFPEQMLLTRCTADSAPKLHPWLMLCILWCLNLGTSCSAFVG